VTVETISTFTDLEGPDFDATIQNVDLVCVTDWNREGLVSQLSTLFAIQLISGACRFA
jgi:hypothetical protein